MNALVWVIQVLLAVLFLGHGLLYTVAYGAVVRRRRATGGEVPRLHPALRQLIGVAEIAAAIGLILPALTGVLPWLTPLAAAGLVIVMAGAIVRHASRGESPQVGLTAVLLVLALVVVTLRAWIVPLGGA
jgi:hypothetical protein